MQEGAEFGPSYKNNTVEMGAGEVIVGAQTNMVVTERTHTGGELKTVTSIGPEVVQTKRVDVMEEAGRKTRDLTIRKWWEVVQCHDWVMDARAAGDEELELHVALHPKDVKVVASLETDAEKGDVKVWVRTSSHSEYC